MTQKIAIREVEQHAKSIEAQNYKNARRSPSYNVIVSSCPLSGYCPDHDYVFVPEDWKQQMEKHLIKDGSLF